MNLRFSVFASNWNELEEKQMKSTSRMKLRALTEGAVFVALAQILGYLKLFELPNGGSI